MKKIAGDIIIFHIVPSHNHMKYSSWDTELNRIFFVILGNFLLFYPLPTPLTTQKTKILKKWKKHLEVSSFWTCATKTRSYDVCILRYGVRQTIFCHFRPFFAFLLHYWHQKFKFGKNVKNTWRYYPFTHVYHISRSYDVWFLRHKVQRSEFLSFWTIFALWPS